MKASAIIRIILWTVVALLLLSILIAGVTGQFRRIFNWNWNWPWSDSGSSSGGDNGYYSSYDEKGYTIGGGRVNAGDVRSISVDWQSGSIEVVPTDDSYISFDETSRVELEEDYRMRFSTEGGVLRIRFAKSRVLFTGFFRSMDKALTVYVPRNMLLNSFSLESVSGSINVAQLQADSFSIDTVSGKLEVSDITADEIDLESVSGRISATKLQTKDLEIDNVSGAIEVTDSSCDRINIESVSGSTDVECNTMPGDVQMDAVSGSITLRIPENDGFTARYEKLSGSFNCDFEAAVSKDEAVYKGGGAHFRFETLSGSISIRKR